MIIDRLYLTSQELSFNAFSKKHNKVYKIKGTFNGTMQIEEHNDYPPDVSDTHIIPIRRPETRIILDCSTEKIKFIEEQK